VSFHITRHQRQRLLDGNYGPLTFKVKPYGCEPGATYVFAHSRGSRHVDELTGHVIEVPAEPAAWITVRKVSRRPDGDWLVRFDVTDRRHLSLMLARGGGYTTDHRQAIDRDEAVLEEDDRKRWAAEARARRLDAQEKNAEQQRRRQERAVRGRLREALRKLDPPGQAALLARVEQAIKDLA
jgi:hypothetical protein